MQLRDDGQCFEPDGEGPAQLEEVEVSVNEQCEHYRSGVDEFVVRKIVAIRIVGLDDSSSRIPDSRVSCISSER